MLLLDLVVALSLAVLFAALFTWGLRRPGPWGGFLWFFLVLFLGTWAIGAWVGPVGPAIGGVAWIPWVVGAFVVALLIASIPAPPRTPPTSPRESETEAVATVALGGFFWLLLLVLLLAIVPAYL